jgi:hexulose-6-phosphate isomerase
MKLGTMQGRLVPPAPGRFQCFPRDDWEREFQLAAQAGLECIEWIFDAYGEDVNPIATAAGLARMGDLARATGVGVFSVCADWFMDFPLVRAEPEALALRERKLAWLLGRCRELGADRVVVPFVDASRIDTGAELDQVARTLERILPAAEAAGVELHLETSLAPAPFRALLDRLPHPLLKANYDSGNSSSLGYAPAEEFAAYGARIGSIHIKDRVLGGGTVPLGTGGADFDALFGAMAGAGYRGDLILQVARGVAGDEVAWARANRAWVLARLAAAGVVVP